MTRHSCADATGSSVNNGLNGNAVLEACQTLIKTTGIDQEFSGKLLDGGLETGSLSTLLCVS